MYDLNEIYGLYDAYIKKVDEIRKNSKITAGLFGLTKGPKDDPCHDRFAEELGAKIKEFASGDPVSGEVYLLLAYMYSVPLKYKDDSMVYWMFTAVHSFSYDLICRLNREDAEKLYNKYVEDYPRWERLPSQKKILKDLKNKI